MANRSDDDQVVTFPSGLEMPMDEYVRVVMGDSAIEAAREARREALARIIKAIDVEFADHPATNPKDGGS